MTSSDTAQAEGPSPFPEAATLEELMHANPTIKNPNKISEGQQITIPGPSDAPPDTIDASATP